MRHALIQFDRDAATTLEGRLILLQHSDNPIVEILPREEVFLISSFLLNARQAA